MKKDWSSPELKGLAFTQTKESKEHHAINSEYSRSTWICSCGETFISKEALKQHIYLFWDSDTGNGTEHWEKQLS